MTSFPQPLKMKHWAQWQVLWGWGGRAFGQDPEWGLGWGGQDHSCWGARKQVGRDLRSSSPLGPPSPPAEVLLRTKYQSLSCVRLFTSPWTIASWAPLSIGFSRWEYWSGQPFPSSGDLSDPGIEPRSPELQARSVPLSHQENLRVNCTSNKLKEKRTWFQLLSRNTLNYTTTLCVLVQSDYCFLFCTQLS